MAPSTMLRMVPLHRSLRFTGEERGCAIALLTRDSGGGVTRSVTEGAYNLYDTQMRSPYRTHKQAKSLRQSMSRAEVLLWVRLRERGPDRPAFRRQHPIGPFITDFCCSTARLVVEIDGGVHRREDRMLRDAEREAYLRQRGYRMLRLTDREVLLDPDRAAESVRAALMPPPSRSA